MNVAMQNAKNRGFYHIFKINFIPVCFAVDGFDEDFHSIVFIGNITQQIEIVVRTVSK